MGSTVGTGITKKFERTSRADPVGQHHGMFRNSLSALGGGVGWGEVGVPVHPRTRTKNDLRQCATDAQRTHQFIAVAIDQSPHLTLALSAPKGGEGTKHDIAKSPPS